MHRDIAAEKAACAEDGDPSKTLGGGVWQNPSVDLATNRIFFVVGNPSPDLDGAIGPATISIRIRWFRSTSIPANTSATSSTSPHDVWDLDAVSPPVLVDVKDKDGNTVPGVLHAGKTGYVYVHNRKDCSLIRFSEADDAAGEHVDAADRGRCADAAGRQWRRRMVADRDEPAAGPRLRHQPASADDLHGRERCLSRRQAVARRRFQGDPHGAEWGNVTAVDYNTGKIRWQVKTPQPMIGGVLATASGLIFTGEGNGLFKAYDAGTGAILWQFQAGAGVNAPPSSYAVNGKQYIVVAAGGNTQLDYKRGNAIIAFTLE